MRGRKRTAVTLAVIGPSTGLLAGGGSRSHTNAATAVARAVAEYMTPAEATCANRSATETIVGNTDGTSLARAQAAIATETAAAKDVLVTIEALTPPAPLQAAHDALVCTSHDSVAMLDTLVSDLRAGNVLPATQAQATIRQADTRAVTHEVAANDLGLVSYLVGTDSTSSSG